jgi:hypothetical protein
MEGNIFGLGNDIAGLEYAFFFIRFLSPVFHLSQASREQYSCGVCYDLYNEPRTLPCAHSACVV